MIDLMSFCDPVRASLREPWSRGEYTFASDGVVGIRVPRRNDVTFERGPNIEKIFDEAREATALQAFPEFDTPPTMEQPMKPCSDCGGIGFTRRCPKCHGSGEHECYACNHEAECGECSGSGDLPVPVFGDGKPTMARKHADAIECDNCGGTGSIRPPAKEWRVELFPGHYFNPLVIKRIAALPGARIDAREFDGGPVRFVFDGGDGLVMPMRPPHGATDLVIRPVAEAAA